MAVHFGDAAVTVRALVVCVFLLLTAPIAAHLIGRAAYHRGIRLFEKTWIDELGGDLIVKPSVSTAYTSMSAQPFIAHERR